MALISRTNKSYVDVCLDRADDTFWKRPDLIDIFIRYNYDICIVPHEAKSRFAELFSH